MTGSDAFDARRPFNLHFHQLAYLREVQRRGSLSAASEHLGISQPALSQSLSELERRLGVRLFERDGRRRRLTEDGLAVAEFARETLARAASFAETLRRRQDGRVGSLRVGMIDAGSLYLLSEAVRRYRESYPDVDLHLTVAASSELEEALRGFEIDLAFLIDDATEHPRIVKQALADEALYLYGPPGATELSDNADFVLYPAGSHTREQIESGLREKGIVPKVRLESSNPQVLRQMVALGFGWSVLPAAVAETPPEPLTRHAGGAVSVRTICMARRKGSPEDPRAEAFLGLARRLSRQVRRGA